MCAKKQSPSASAVKRRHGNRKCRLIIDSCSDIPRSLYETYDVELLEYAYVMKDGEHLDDFGKTMSNKKFYARMLAGEFPKTSQVPLGRLKQLFAKIAQDGEPAVMLSFSSRLSGTFEMAQTALSETLEEYPSAEIYLVDTKLASVAEGLLVVGAVHLLDTGISAAELRDWAIEASPYVHGYFTVDSLEWLRAGGRIPDIAAALGTKLDIKPVLTIDPAGNLAQYSMARGRKKALRQLVEIYKEKAIEGTGSTVMVGHGDCVKDADKVADALLKIPVSGTVIRSEIGPVIGSHTGPGMAAVVFWSETPRSGLSITDRIASAVKARQSK